MPVQELPQWRRTIRHVALVAWILVKLTLVSALLSPGVKELVYAGF